MNTINDRIFLLLFSFLYCTHIKTDSLFICSLLIAIIYSFSEELFRTKKWDTLISWGYLPFLFFFPPFLYSYSIISYACIRRKQCYTVLIAVLIGFRYFIYISRSPSDFFIFLLGIIFSAYFYFNTERFHTLRCKFINTIDTDREKQLQLAEKNHILMENQDYKIYAATLKERNRIAREIHDNVGHLLSRSILLVGAIKIINKNLALTEPINNLDMSLNSAMTSIRSSVHDLHDEAVNLSDVIHDLVDSFDFCPIELKYDMGHDTPREIKYAFIAITKEALTNITKHSNATKVSILMREQPALYQLIIQDNGDCNSIHNSGIGLSNMRDRVTILKGTIHFSMTNGFRIFITIPKERNET